MKKVIVPILWTVGLLLVTGTVLSYLKFESTFVNFVADMCKTIGWSVLWVIVLALRTITELVLALAEWILELIQGQTDWLPIIPRLYKL